MSKQRTVQDWARLYIKRNWQVVPLAPGTKRASDEKWLELVFKPEDFREGDNIGIRSVGGLIVVDEDCPEAVAVADAFLPATGAIYGRASKPRSKRLYISPFEKTIAFKDMESSGQTLIEIRAKHQDMAPSSVHPSGEVLEWVEPFGDAASVEPAELLRAVRLVATCSLIARYYNPEGARHEWTLALCGYLRMLGVTQEEAGRIFTEAGRWAKDAKLDDRLTEVRTTFIKDDAEPISGAKALTELMPTGKGFVNSLSKIWGGGGKSGGFIINEKTQHPTANNQDNIRVALKKMDVTLSFDVFAQKAMITAGEHYSGPLQDSIITRLWMDIDTIFHFRPTKEYFFDVVQDTAARNPYHPVRDYLRSLTWDGTPRLDAWLIDHASAADTVYVRAVSSLVLLAAVRRVTQPGCKFDEMLVLESGEQGLEKSSALRALCPVEDWFSDDLPLNVDAKQIIERTLGKWIVEASDLSGMHKSQVEQLKGMLSRQVDGPVRLAYARVPVEQRRQWIVIGTTNNHQYLTDATGNRRFWPIRVGRFNVAKLKEHRDQIWAEAYAREQAGASIRLSPELWPHATLQQNRRRTDDPWETTIAEAFSEEYQRLTPLQIWEVLGIPTERRTVQQARRVAEVLQSLGFRRVTVKDEGGKVIKGWGRGSKLLETPGTEQWEH